ncbi:hypothetical protein BXZ70DRAFT_427008 [Cristinia sonorae]|uniref:F-box domain-containing protein n=1 Tax=Cristinia sonorae TaxID=1940300 RepID=A0A8K0UWB9_9AGAR|nr:hypothetical protein BXZ70DRAFT_427008 [Cristinia sonorae]
MSFTALPPELLDDIFHSLPTSSLLALATTCSSFTPSADRILYRHIALSSHTHNLNAVHTLASHPALSSLVRTFTLDVDDADPTTADFYVALQRALRHMEGLTSLELNVGINESWVLKCGDRESAYPSLQHFSTSVIFDVNTISFLLRTPSLLSLQLSSSVSPSDVAALEIPTEAIPELESYTGPASLLRHLSPRPLTTLLLSDDLAIDDVQYLSSAARAPSSSAGTVASCCMTIPDGCARPPTDVQVLSAITSASPAVMIEALAEACPHLTCLRVMTTCAFWEAPDLSFYNRIAQTLSTLPSLTAFELSGMHWESRPKSSVTGILDVSEKEWVSPPVTPRVVDVEFQENQREHEFSVNEAFLDWSY